MSEHKEAAKEQELAAAERQALDIVLDSPELVDRVLMHREMQIQISRSHSGPLPSPEDLAHYSQLIENGAERIMKMAEQEQQHRLARQTKNDNAVNRLNANGQIFGFVSVLLVIAFSISLLIAGHAGLAAAVITGTMVSIAGVFVLGKKFKQ